jgi:hypothetical protein
MKVSVLLTLLILAVQTGWGQGLAINEVMSSNGVTISDEDGDFEDWIELYNFGETTVNLGGFFLSDDDDNPQRWTFPDTTLHPGGFLLVWASGKDRAEDGVLHTNFSISQGGEEILLSNAGGVLVDRMAPISIPRDRSYGRQPDGTGEWVFFTDPTPGAANLTDAFGSFLEPPSSSVQPGFHSGTIALELSTGRPDATIYYTLDGSIPDENSHVYTSPIHVRDRSSDPEVISLIRTTWDNWRIPPSGQFKATAVRAIAVAQGHVTSEVSTQSYFVNPGIHDRYRLPIVSITIDADSLFDYHRGIYVPGVHWDRKDLDILPHSANYMARGADWERAANLEFFEADGVRVASLGAGLRIHGGWTRSARMKSLRIYFREEYDEQNALEYSIFPGQDRAHYKRLVLRNSGNDFGFSMFRDGLMHRLVHHLGFDTQDFRPMAVFINGEFWGLHNLRERFDDRYIENIYGVPRDEVDMLENTGDVVYGDAGHYARLVNDVSAGAALSSIEARMDLDNYINYYVSQIYFDNRDWPGNNMRFWRKRTASYDPDAPHGHDGRWRWMMYDTDFGFNLYGTSNAFNNTLRHATGAQPLNDWAAHPSAVRMFDGLLQYPEFRARFMNTFADHLNTAFRPQRVIALIDEMQEEIRPIYDEHRRRWSLRDVGSWEWEVGTMRTFAEQRPSIQRNHITNYFSETTGTAQLTVNVSDPAHGSIRVNTIDIDGTTPGIANPSKPYPWAGTYFRNVPVTLIARPIPGFRTVSWEGIDAGATDTVRVTLTGNRTLTAVFERVTDPEPAPHVLVEGTYMFAGWPADAEPGTYPAHMEFRQSRVKDPTLTSDFPDLYTLPYDLEARTRIVGLGDGGFAFINTGANDEWMDGASGRDLGAAVFGLNTEGCSGVSVTWRGSTVRPNAREYGVRLQYRIEDYGPFHDVLDDEGQPVEYVTNPTEGHSMTFADVDLPSVATDRPYIQLRWLYYHRSGDSGPRAMLGVSGISTSCSTASVSAEMPDTAPTAFVLHPNYPNPFNPSTLIRYELPEPGHVTLTVLNVLGQRVATLVDDGHAAGAYETTFDGGNLPSGVYLYRLEAGSHVRTRSMILLK